MMTEVEDSLQNKHVGLTDSLVSSTPFPLMYMFSPRWETFKLGCGVAGRNLNREAMQLGRQTVWIVFLQLLSLV